MPENHSERFFARSAVETKNIYQRSYIMPDRKVNIPQIEFLRPRRRILRIQVMICLLVAMIQHRSNTNPNEMRENKYIPSR